ncbi:MAG: CHAT domain-containing tetratricopeptide repeat protein [Bacteroidota bacterium]|jgi:CHAT domain-containing protein/tetratricopeptide (TPR) repeat protein
MTRRIHFFIFPFILLLAACSGGGDVLREDPRITEGRSLYDRADFDRAEKHFKGLREEGERLGDELLEAQAEKWLGSIQLAYEQSETALLHYRRSLALLESGILRGDSLGTPVDRRWFDERQNVLSNTGVVYKGAQRFQEAEELFRGVLAYDSARGDDYRTAISLYNLGDVYHQHAVVRLSANDSTAAAGLHQQARLCFLRSLAQYPTADAWLNLGNNYTLDNSLDSAIVCYRRAEEIYGRDGFRVHRALALGNIGVLAQRLGRREEAARVLEQSIDIIEELRGNLSSVDVRTSFVSNKFYIYENLIEILVANGEVTRAFEYVERAKARSFLDLIGNKAVGQGKERPPEVERLVQREQELQQIISRLITDTDSSNALGTAITEHQRVLAELSEKDPEYASVKSIDPVPVKLLQSMLDDSTAVIEYFVGQSASFVFLVRRDTILVQPVSIAPDFKLEMEIERLRRKLYYDFPMKKIGFIREQRLGQKSSSEDALRAWYALPSDNSWQFDLVTMYSLLVAPVASALQGITQLYVVPHGPLHHLPFQALINPVLIDIGMEKHMARPRYLIEDFAIAYLPSASVLSFALEKKMHRATTALIIGDPLYADPKYRRRPLDGALIEADTVAGYAEDALVLKREAAEESVVKSIMGTRDLLHFATHGELNKDDPMQSRILLAAAHPDSLNNGNLTVAKIFNLDLSATLVTLSACQTAQLSVGEGGFSAGDDLVGLTRSFMYAGTPSVIASLWVVDDAATLTWMRNFYRAWLRQGMSKMQAARSAALDMLTNADDPDWMFPYYWSAFVYMGDAR